MNPDRAIALVLAISLGVVLLLGLWLLRGARPDAEPRADAPTMGPSATEPPRPTATPAVGTVPVSARGFRLAGTVVGDLSYAIIEDPTGANQLYRPGQTVPGLGEITAIDADRITLSGSGGSFTLLLGPAPTTTPTPLRLDASGSRPSPVVTPARRLPHDRSGSESSP